MEQFPTTPPKPEHEPGSYEHALEAVRALKADGIRNPLDSEDPAVLDRLDALEQWYYARGLNMAGVETVEKAQDLVRAARVFLDGGYTGKRFMKAAIEKLQDEHTAAMREGNAEAAAVIGAALDELEGQLGRSDPKEKMPAILAAKVEEAMAFAEQGKARDAAVVLTLALIDPRFKRLPKAELARIQELRDAYKARM